MDTKDRKVWDLVVAWRNSATKLCEMAGISMAILDLPVRQLAML